MKAWNTVRCESVDALKVMLNQIEKDGCTVFQLLPAAPMALAFIIYYAEDKREKLEVELKGATDQKRQVDHAQHG